MPLTSVHVEDARIHVSNLVVPNLAVGASETVTADYTITAQDMIDRNITNQATATGTSPKGDDVTDLSDDNNTVEDDPTVTPLKEHPSIAIVKTSTIVDGDGVSHVGDIIRYAFLVANMGDVPLANVVVNDARIGVSNLPVPNLMVDMNYTVYADYHITSQDLIDGKVVNKAIARGTSPKGDDVYDTSDDNSLFEDDETVTILNKLGSWSGRVMQDTNLDDLGDTPLADVLLKLTYLDGQKNIIRVTRTDKNGKYLFSNLYQGHYKVEEVQPNILLSVSENEGGDDNDAGDDGKVNSIKGVVSSGEEDTGNDFVEALPYPKPIVECDTGFWYYEFNPEFKTVGRLSDTDLRFNIKKISLLPDSEIYINKVLTYDYGGQDQKHEQYKMEAYNRYGVVGSTYYTQDIDNTSSKDVISDIGGFKNTSKRKASLRLAHWTADHYSGTANSVTIKSFCYRISPTPYYFETPPEAVSDLKVSDKDRSSVVLSWKDNSDNEDGFTIYKDGIAIKSVDSDMVSVKIEGLRAEQNYTFGVKAFNEYGKSEKRTVSLRVKDDFGWLPAIYNIILN